MKKRLLSWLLVLTMVIPLIPSTLITTALAAPATPAASNGVDISTVQTLADDADITATGVYKISGSRQKPVKITTSEKVTLVLSDATITTATSPIELGENAKVTIVVEDGTSNTLTCTAAAVNAANNGKTAGILVPATASLTIDRAVGDTGTGKLSVTGGYGGAGIGGSYTATYGTRQNGGGQGGQGEQGNGSGGTTSFNHYNWVNGGSGGRGGSGGQGGRDGNAASNAGTITINSGVVQANGGTDAAGIGGG